MVRRGKKAALAAMTAVLAILLAGPVLLACGDGATATPASQAEAYVSSNLDAAYEDALPAATQLALGTLLLEGTPNAVTAEQARTLRPLWQALQGGALQGQTEVNAVMGQVERAMRSEQLAAIAAMRLTADSLAAWMQERGFSMPQQGDGPPGGGGTPGAGRRGTPGAGGPGNMAPEAQQTMRAGFDSMPQEERARMATAQAGGMPGGGFPGGAGRGGGGMGQMFMLLDPLIELLTQRAGS